MDSYLSLATVDPLLGGDKLLRVQTHDKRITSLTTQVNQVVVVQKRIEGHSAKITV